MIASNYGIFTAIAESRVKILFYSGTGGHLETDAARLQRKIRCCGESRLWLRRAGLCLTRRTFSLIDDVSYYASDHRSDYGSGHYVARAAVMMRSRRRRGRRRRRPGRTRRGSGRRGRRMRPRRRSVYPRPAVVRSRRRRSGEGLRTSREHRRGCENSGYLSYSSPKWARHKLSPRLFSI